MIAGRPRILLNGSAIPPRPAGAGIYTIELARALARRADIDLVLASPTAVEGVAHEPSPAAGALRRSAWEQRTLPALLAGGFDLCHGAHMAVPLRSPVPTVATMHDLTFHRLPRRYSLQHRWYYRGLARLAARAQRIIVPSSAVASDTVRHLGYAPERIRVVPEAPRAGFAPASDGEVAAVTTRLGLEPPYLLCVGTAEPGKRAVDALRAVALLRERGISVQLALAGNAGALLPGLKREAVRLGVADRVRFLGYVADADLPALYTGATALIFPSLYEGFGLPPLEAMACGTPVIASDAPAMDEVLAGAALFTPLRDASAIATHAAALLASDSLRNEWAGRGRAHVTRYSWDRAAAETIEVYREVIAP